jgi:hypothetical protein
VIAIDTNILVYAHRKDTAFHEAAWNCVAEHAEGPDPWAIPWPCVHEFLSIVTNPRIYKSPTPMRAAIAQIEAWRESPSLCFLSEEEGYWEELVLLLSKSRVVGPRVHDARIAGLAIRYGVRELLSADRDFGRFSALHVRNPL